MPWHGTCTITVARRSNECPAGRQSWNINGIMTFALITVAIALAAREANIAVNTVRTPGTRWNWPVTANILGVA